MSRPPGVEADEYNRAVCQAKPVLPSTTFALNKAWLVATASRTRTAVYTCGVCGRLHLSAKVDGENAVFCSTWELRP